MIFYLLLPVFDLVQNIVGKGENAGYQHFLLFPKCFKNAIFPRVAICKGLSLTKMIE